MLPETASNQNPFLSPEAPEVVSLHIPPSTPSSLVLFPRIPEAVYKSPIQHHSKFSPIKQKQSHTHSLQQILYGFHIPTIFAVIVQILISVSEILSFGVYSLSSSKSLSFSSAYSLRRLIARFISGAIASPDEDGGHLWIQGGDEFRVSVIQSRVVMAPIVDATLIVQIKLNRTAENPPTTMAETERRYDYQVMNPQLF
ncbi:hypothetical protein Bca4012_012875 [Brassica carinata]